MPQYAWMPLNKQDSEYAWCPKYAKVLYIGKFWMLQASEYAMVTQLFEYARRCHCRVPSMSWDLHIQGFWIWEGTKYAGVTQRSNYATI